MYLHADVEILCTKMNNIPYILLLDIRLWLKFFFVCLFVLFFCLFVLYPKTYFTLITVSAVLLGQNEKKITTIFQKCNENDRYGHLSNTFTFKSTWPRKHDVTLIPFVRTFRMSLNGFGSPGSFAEDYRVSKVVHRKLKSVLFVTA